MARTVHDALLPQLIIDLRRQAIEISIKLVEGGERAFHPHSIMVDDDGGALRWTLEAHFCGHPHGTPGRAAATIGPRPSLVGYAVAAYGVPVDTTESEEVIAVEVGTPHEAYEFVQHYSVAKRWTGRTRVVRIGDVKMARQVRSRLQPAATGGAEPARPESDVDSLSLSDVLTALVGHVINAGVGAMEGGSVPFYPIAIVVDDVPAGQEPVAFYPNLSGDSTEALEMARGIIGPGRSQMAYALAWDGFVDAEGLRTDAIIMEIGDADGSYTITHRYRLSQDASGQDRVELIDRPRLDERLPARLSPTNA